MYEMQVGRSVCVQLLEALCSNSVDTGRERSNARPNDRLVRIAAKVVAVALMSRFRVD